LTKKNEKHILNVYYVRDLKHNLISVGKLRQNRYEVIFKGPTCAIIYKPPSRRLIAKIQMNKNIMVPSVMIFIAQVVGWENPNPTSEMETTKGQYTQCHLDIGLTLQGD